MQGGPRGGPVSGVRERVARVAPASWSGARDVRTLTRMLDRAAQAPAGTVLRSGTGAAPLAGLAGIAPAEYLRRSPADQYAARLEIERELDRRREACARWSRHRCGLTGTKPALASPAAADAREPDSGPLARRARQFGSWLR